MNIQKRKELIKQDQEFQTIIQELIKNETVQEMKQYRQHYETTCYDHCYTVAYYCYLVCKKYHLDYHSAARAGMLHDLFLYDWRKKRHGENGLHAFTHGKLACKNATQLFSLNEKEKDMITKHMWPVTVEFPKSLEGLILTFVDKYCAISETFEVWQSKVFMKKQLRYAYIFSAFLILRF